MPRDRTFDLLTLNFAGSSSLNYEPDSGPETERQKSLVFQKQKAKIPVGISKMYGVGSRVRISKYRFSSFRSEPGT